LGWSPRGEDEVVPFEELVREFRLEDVSHSPAFFDVKKLTHLNGEYIRQLSSEQFLDEAAPWVTPESAPWRPREYATPWPTERFRADVFAAIAPLVQERIARLDEIPAMVDFLFTSDAPYDEAAFDKAIRSNELSRQILATLVDELATAAFSPEELHALVAAVGERFEVTLRKAQAPVRVALTGRTIGPPLFEAMVILGRDEVRDRLGRALARC
jgi:glutamyl-tRNA synthetase